MLPKELFWDNLKDVQEVAFLLQQGQVVAGTGDTVLGLMAAVSLEGKLALDSIKNRADKPYIVLIGSQEGLKGFTDQVFSLQIQTILDQCWPGPLTAIIKAKPSLPDWLKSSNGTIALRFPAHAGLQTLLQQIPALFSTSANISGGPIPASYQDIAPQMSASLASYILDKNSQNTPQPSTIIDLTTTPPTIVRTGACDVEGLKRHFGAQ